MAGQISMDVALMIRYLAALLAGLLMTPGASAALDEIVNFRQYSPTFASAGQPTEAQLQAVADAGFKRVIYIAFSDQERALPHEDRLVKSLGMDYLHIPVDWTHPTVDDFNAFADAMNRQPATPTLLHCQVNARATVFSFLYRVIHEGVDIKVAKADMNSVWQPDEVWRDLIFSVLDTHGISPDCDACDWTPGVYE